MIIELRDSDLNKLWPEAATVLETLTVPLFHHSYSRRHPLGIYNTSLAVVIDRFRRALEDSTQVMMQNPQTDNSENVERKNLEEDFLVTYQALLYALFEHLEDCKKLVECFYVNKRACWMDVNALTYKGNIKSYRNRLGAIVNKIKHNQNRLRMIWMSGPMAWSYGYFVEAVQPDGALGPNPEIHKGGDTGISFGYDFRFHFVQLYKVSGHLHDFVKALDPNVEMKTKNECPWAMDLARQIQGLSNFRFPNEVQEPDPELLVSDHNGELTLRLGLDTGMTRPTSITKLPGPIRIGCSYSGDGVTRSFRIPYSTWKP